MNSRVEARLGAESVAPHGGADAAGELHHIGELQALLTDGVAEPMDVGNHLLPEPLLVLRAVEIGVDLGVVALLLQDGEVMQHFGLVLGSSAEQVLEVELDEAVGVAVFKEFRFVQAALGHLADELAHAQIAPLEEGFGAFEPLAGHDVLVAEHLAVDGPNQDLLVIFGGVRPVFLVAGAGETLDAQIGGVGESHGRGIEGGRGVGKSA